MSFPNLKSLVLAAALAAAGADVLATAYYVVVPVKGRTGPAREGPDGPVLSASRLSFGTKQVGDAGLPLALTLTNPGPKRLSISTITIPDAAANQGFSLQHACATLDAGETCTGYVYYRPVTPGSHQGDLVVEHDGWRGMAKVALSGDARMPSATLARPTFGDVNVGSSKDRISKLTNTGVGNITVGVPSVTGTGFSFISSDCPSPLGPGDSCDITTRFTAPSTGPAAGALSVATGAGALSAKLEGMGVSSDLAFSSGPVAGFGSASTGSTSSKQVTLTNVGNRPANDLVLDIEPSAGYTVQGSTCGTALAAGDSCTFSVQFSPVNAGAYLADLTAKVGGESAASSPLSGVGTSAAVFLTSSVQNSVVIVGTVNSEYYTVTNSSSSPVTIQNKSLSHPAPALTYTMTGGTNECPNVIPAKTSCRINISLQSSDQFTSSPLALTLNTSVGQLTARTMGVNASWAKLTTTPDSPAFNFGNVALGASVTSTKVTVTNTASSPAANTASYSVPEGFEMVGSSCGVTSNRSSVCELYLKFTPTAAKAYKGTFTMTTRTAYSGTGGTPQPYVLSIPLSGVGTAPATLGWQGGELDTVEVGVTRTTKLTLYNPGPASVVVGAVSLAGNTSEFRLVGTTCAATLSAAASCTATLDFTPTATGARPAVTVSAPVDGAAVAKQISGTAGVATFTATPVSLKFSSRYANLPGVYDAFQDLKLTLKNTGAAAAEQLSSSIVHDSPGSGLSFSLQYNSCVKRLNAGSSCTTNVRAIGTVVGTYSGVVVFKSMSGEIRVPYTFTVVPMDIPLVTVTAAKDTVVGKGTVSSYTVSTSSVGKVVLDVPTISGNTSEYSLAAGSNCSGILPLNSTCTVNVLFTPTGEGPRPQATLNVKYGGVTRTVTLGAAGIPAP